MRKISWNQADRLLFIIGVFFFLFSAARIFIKEHIIFDSLYAFFEAALIGGIADWFAVSALFRKPFGFAWHTAIIPKNRGNLIQGLVRMIQNEFLSPEIIKKQLGQISLAEGLLQWLASRRKRMVIAVLIAKHLRTSLKHLDRHKTAALLAPYCQKWLKKEPIVPLIVFLLSWGLHNHKEQQCLDLLLAKLNERVRQPQFQQVIYELLLSYRDAELSQGGSMKQLLNTMLMSTLEKLNMVNMEEAAAIIHYRLQNLLQEILADMHHPVRLWLKKQLIKTKVMLTQDQDLIDTVEQWKNEWVDWLPLENMLAFLLAHILPNEFVFAKSVRGAKQEEPGQEYQETRNRCLFFPVFLQQIESSWNVFRQDAELVEALEDCLQSMAVSLLEEKHEIVGKTIEEVLYSLTDEALNRLIESKISNDLEWIRINGSVIGGTIGMMFFWINYWFKL
jgi:uncharacterized membrane-anchored protein YjiN (DUF445 family)